HRRLEEEGEEGSREQDGDEAVEGDLAEHERPVVGEDLATNLADESAVARALVDVGRRSVREAHASAGALRLVSSGGAHYSSRSQKLGPTGSRESLCATR